MNDKATVLIIDDDPNNVDILTLDLEEDYHILSAEDGVQGWDVLQANRDKVSVILLDRMMPNMNGMEFLAKVKGDPSVARKPVIMQTAAAEKSQVAEGIKAGAYYYLTKPYDVAVMRSVVKAAAEDYASYHRMREELNEHQQKLKLIKKSHFEVRTLEDARYLATFLANFFPDKNRVIMGISELLINAIEHGNLGITYDEKSQLNLEGNWEEEVQRRQQLPEHQGKIVEVVFERHGDALTLEIIDQGDGFDWQRYMEIDPARATDNHGRGIALSNMMSFDALRYQGKGNHVTCTVTLS